MAATIHEATNGWHPGEMAMHKLLKAPSAQENPSSAGLSPSYGYRVAVSPLMALGALDGAGRPWTTIWGGERGFARPVAPNVLGVQTLADRTHDPVLEALLGPASATDGELVRPAKDDRGVPVVPMSALSIDLATRDRVKLAGRMLVGAVTPRTGDAGAGDAAGTVGEVQVAMLVQESLGNCPKYINKKEVQAHVPVPRLVSSALPLPQEALDLIARADMFFLSSADAAGTAMDTNHRGGAAGFVRVLANDAADGVALVYPEYSGNRLYQTLGNLHVNPRVGLVVPDLATSSVLYLTGEARVLVGTDAAALLPRTSLVVRIDVHAARLVRDGLPFRTAAGAAIDEPSPYNPPVRRLASEGAADPRTSSSAPATATLLRREHLSPSVCRFTFRLRPERPARAGKEQGATAPPLRLWRPGQHVTLDFSGELDVGWSHMRDDDPRSLNDDFIRTFTVSNPPPPTANADEDDDPAIVPEEGVEMQITARRHGPATDLLWRRDLRAPLELPVLGFGGHEAFRLPTRRAQDIGGKSEQEKEQIVYIAGGVGITPLLAQAAAAAAAALTGRGNELLPVLHVLWSLRRADLPFALDTFARIPGLAARTRLFVTGAGAADTFASHADEAGAAGARLAMRRMLVDDVRLAGEGSAPMRYFVCAGREMHRVVVGWLDGDGADSGVVVSESFDY